MDEHQSSKTAEKTYVMMCWTMVVYHTCWSSSIKKKSLVINKNWLSCGHEPNNQ